MQGTNVQEDCEEVSPQEDEFLSHARTALAAVSSREIARRLVRKRTKVLRSMIPGGQLLADEVTLLREAMDYVVHLHAQADVLWRVSKATTQRR
jgi:hypothetical protein